MGIKDKSLLYYIRPLFINKKDTNPDNEFNKHFGHAKEFNGLHPSFLQLC